MCCRGCAGGSSSDNAEPLWFPQRRHLRCAKAFAGGFASLFPLHPSSHSRVCVMSITGKIWDQEPSEQKELHELGAHLCIIS